MTRIRSRCPRRSSRRNFRTAGRWSIGGRGMRRIRPTPIVWRRATQIWERVSRLADADTANHVRGIEGDAARTYFGAVAQVVSKSDIGFSKRTRRPPRDPVNAMLGFCYGLLVTEVIGAVESVGLDYQMGFFHRPRSAGRRWPLTLLKSYGR